MLKPTKDKIIQYYKNTLCYKNDSAWMEPDCLFEVAIGLG